MIRRLGVYLLGCVALPGAFFAVVFLRDEPVRDFWRLYWAEVALAARGGA